MPETREAETPDGDDPSPGSTIAALRSSPGRIVFTERDNTDGWIATDLTVEPER